MGESTALSDLQEDKLVGQYVQKPVLVNLNESTKNVARIMAANDSCSAVVTLKDEPVGIVTEWDILTRLVVLGKDASRTPVREVMSAPLWSVSKSTKVGEAIALMSKNGFRRLVVSDGKNPVGIISCSQILGNRREDSIPIARLETSNGLGCPFCGFVFKNKEEISQHVDEELALRMRNKTD